MVKEERKIGTFYASNAELFDLDEKQKQELLDCAGYDDEKEFKQSIFGLDDAEEIEAETHDYNKGQALLYYTQYALGLYKHGIQWLDNEPSALQKHKKITELHDIAYKLYWEIGNLDPYNRAEIKYGGYKYGSLFTELDNFLFASQKAMQRINSSHEDQSQYRKRGKGAGRKTQKSRQLVIDMLTHYFDKYCQLENPKAHKIKYIRLALKYAEIDLPQNLGRLVQPQATKVTIKQ